MYNLLNTINNVFVKKVWADSTEIGGQDINVNFPIFKNWTSIEDLFTHVDSLIQFLVLFSAVVCVAMIIVGGYTMITSTGDPEKVERGQKTLTGAVIGLIICFVAWLIVVFVLNVIGVE
jgi:hypothetical protein